MIFLAADDGKGPVELLQEEKAGHFMGQGQPGKGKDFMGPGQYLL